MPNSVVGFALETVPVEDSRCLEAAAGAGNTSAALLERDPAVVYAVANDAEHAVGVARPVRYRPTTRHSGYSAEAHRL